MGMARDFENKDLNTPIHQSDRFLVALEEIKRQQEMGRNKLNTRSQNRTPESVLKALSGAGYNIKHSGHDWIIV